MIYLCPDIFMSNVLRLGVCTVNLDVLVNYRGNRCHHYYRHKCLDISTSKLAPFSILHGLNSWENSKDPLNCILLRRATSLLYLLSVMILYRFSHQLKQILIQLHSQRTIRELSAPQMWSRMWRTFRTAQRPVAPIRRNCRSSRTFQRTSCPLYWTY